MGSGTWNSGGGAAEAGAVEDGVRDGVEGCRWYRAHTPATVVAGLPTAAALAAGRA